MFRSTTDEEVAGYGNEWIACVCVYGSSTMGTQFMKAIE